MEKIQPLKSAIQSHLHQGARIHISDISSYPMAAINELVRQYWGTKAGFTIITSGLHNQTLPLLLGGFVDKIIHSFAGDIYPTPAPIPVFQQLLAEGKVAYERWSMFGLVQRLNAGAMNVGFLPLPSITGSDIATENPDAFKMVEDPFEPGRKIGAVKALRPDITLIHGIMGDPKGNTILPPLSVTGIPGVFASTQGAVVTVEKIVPTDVLRKYSHLVKIPGHMVKSITEVPFGAHPWSLVNPGVKEVAGYDYDYQLLTEGHKACEELKPLKTFIKDWILSCPSHQEHLERLGTSRLEGLKKNYRDINQAKIQPLKIQKRVRTSVSFTPQEIRIYSVAMKISELIREKRYPMITAGIGVGNIAAWIAKELLQREGIHTELAVDTGIIGYQPQTGDPFILSLRNILAANILTNVSEFYTLFCQRGRRRNLGVLGSGQVDQYGNLNSTFIPPDIYLPGSGGANDIAAHSDEVIVSMPQSKRRLVDKVPYITCPGDNVTTLITDLGVFRKKPGEEAFTLTEYFCLPMEKDEDECVFDIQEKCGWPIKISPDLVAVREVPRLFLDVLDAFDPQRYFREGFY
jgi:acyl CoA:acetate/3-ketoacid CoA transferase beta subunit/acyl CoA:acetate/3-ketoacid CoA transferase alpha subunit